jgi:hypothetical protein
MGVKHKKAKGNRAEEFIALKIRETFNLNDDEAFRAPHSGMANKELGDISILRRIREEKLPFVFESKNIEGWDLRHIWPELGKGILDCYKQAEDACVNTQFHPVLVLTKARFPYLAIIQEEYLNKFDSKQSYRSRTYLMRLKNNFYIFDLVDFLTYVKETYGR